MNKLTLQDWLLAGSFAAGYVVVLELITIGSRLASHGEMATPDRWALLAAAVVIGLGTLGFAFMISTLSRWEAAAAVFPWVGMVGGIGASLLAADRMEISRFVEQALFGLFLGVALYGLRTVQRRRFVSSAGGRQWNRSHEAG